MKQQAKYQGALKVTQNFFLMCVHSSIGSLAKAGARGLFTFHGSQEYMLKSLNWLHTFPVSSFSSAIDNTLASLVLFGWWFLNSLFNVGIWCAIGMVSMMQCMRTTSLRMFLFIFSACERIQTDCYNRTQTVQNLKWDGLLLDNMLRAKVVQ